MKIVRYRIVRDSYCCYEAQVWRLWFPFWVMYGGVNTFLSIEQAEDTVDRIEESIEKAKEQYKEDREAINKQIKAYEARINKLIANK